MIRIFMPDGKSRQLKGTVRVVIGDTAVRCLVQGQDRKVLKVDPIAIVYRGRKCVYSPRWYPSKLSEDDRRFLAEFPDWREDKDGMPARRQVCLPNEVERLNVFELAARIYEGAEDQ